jgi:hypothetical protein
MTDNLNELLEKAKSVKVSPEQKEEQRRSFAYGNTNIENPRITRETVDQAAEQLKKANGVSRRSKVSANDKQAGELHNFCAT